MKTVSIEEMLKTNKMASFKHLLLICIAQIFMASTLFGQVAKLNAPAGMTNYQWYKSTSSGVQAINNETSAQLDVTDPGIYFAEYEGSNCGSVTDYFILTPGEGGDTEVLLNAPAGYSYQWFADESEIFGETGTLLSVTATEDAVKYYAETTHSSGKVTETSAFTVMRLEGNPCDNGPHIADCDGDGVANIYDDYPNDSNKAANSYYPGENSRATLAFEDLWPLVGDYDFNDTAIEYRITTVTNAQNQVVELIFNVVLVNNDGVFANAFAFEIEGLDPANVASVTGQQLSENLFSLEENGTEISQTNTVIAIFDKDIAVLDQAIQVTVSMDSPQALGSISTAPFDPFLVINGNREMEVHLIGEDVTDLGNATPQVTGGNADTDGNYTTDTGLPWAINIVGKIILPLDQEPINEAYIHFNEWATSGGNSRADWYYDKPGYRNPDKLQEH